MSKILPFQYVINIKIIDKFYIFFILNLQNMVYALYLTAHFNTDQPHFKWLIATCGYCYHIGKSRSRPLSLTIMYEVILLFT